MIIHVARRAAAVAAAIAIGTAAVLAGVASGVAEAQVSAGWHIFVYMVNDTEADLPLGLDIDEMVDASRAGVDFTLYVDNSEASARYFESAHVPNTGEALIVEITGGTATITQRLGELDSGSPETLGWFVAHGLQAHPTEKAALVVWDHGLGWKGIAFDEDVTDDGATRPVTYLDAAELGSAIEAGLAAAGRDQFDLLFLDACNMANFEIVSETHSTARYLVASEELVPGLGLDYDAFEVFADPAADVNVIFDEVAAGFVADVEQQTPNQSDMLHLSLIDLAHAPALDAAMSDFALVAGADVMANPQPYLRAASEAFKYGDTGDHWPGFLDLGEYVTGLNGIGPDVVAARSNLLATIDAAVVDQIGSESYANATGLTVYFPIEPREYHSSYDGLPSAQLWNPFLSSYYDAQANVVAQSDIGFVGESLDVTAIEQGQYAIEAPVTANFTGTIELLAALPDASGQLNYFETDSGTVQGDMATAILYPSLTTVSDGTTSAVPFTRYVREADGWHGYSQFTLQRPNGTLANLNWDRRESNTGPFTIVDPAGMIVGYTPTDGDLAYPIVMIQPAGGQPERQATAPALDPTQRWTVVDAPIAPGTRVFVELQLKDAAGIVVDSRSGYFTVGQ